MGFTALTKVAAGWGQVVGYLPLIIAGCHSTDQSGSRLVASGRVPFIVGCHSCDQIGSRVMANGRVPATEGLVVPKLPPTLSVRSKIFLRSGPRNSNFK